MSNSMRFVTDLSKGVLGQPDSAELWSEIIAHIPDEVLLKPGVRILSVACGHCTEALLIAKRMLALGVSKEAVRDAIWLIDKYQQFTNDAVVRYGFKNVVQQDFLTWEPGMKFDVVVGNPPYNSAKESTGGTGGNSRLYLHFREKALAVLRESGLLVFITPKNIIKKLISDGNQIDLINLMTEKEYWRFNTLYFIEQKCPKVSDYAVSGGICAKLFSVNEWNYNEFNKTESRAGTGDVRAIIDLPKEKNAFSVQLASVKVALEAAPRVGFSLLESKKSYVVSTLPYCASMSGCVTFSSLSDANAYKLFLENNKALRYFFNAMKLKGYAKDISRFTKRIDLSQIVTGFEYPREWNLTKEEIAYIEETVK